MTTLNGSSIPAPSQAQLDRGYGAAPTAKDFGATPAIPNESSPLSQSAAQQNGGRFNEDFDASQRGSSIIDDPMQRSNSVLSQGDTLIPSRGGTLKKKASLRKTGSLKRSGSRRSSRAGSVRSLALHPGAEADEAHSAFYSPVPTTGNPTEILSNRFQAWRKVLKDLIAYFREIQASYEHRAKNTLKISNVINNTAAPSVFLQSGGIDDAVQVLRTFHKTAITEANKSKEIESDVILALIGLRNDLNQKIKEIKNLSGDFKNSVDKEMDSTRKAVDGLQDSLGQADVDPAQMTGKQDPYLLKLAVDRQVEKQIDEENYLHQAYLNLEASGRELESIVVGEIQKSYNAYAGILRREADAAYNTVEELRTGPIAMPKDHEWNEFVQHDEHFIDPRLPVRSAQSIYYPGRDNYLAQAVREGLMERKSKYLKSYTPGWYVLTPTHLHEFKSADKAQAPIMSLYLPEQKLGSQSSAGASSNKFMLKGRQTGTMHRGHSWVFRCESFETMLAWVSDLKTLTEKSPQERNAFVRQHARSVSGSSQRAASISSDGVMDEEDEEPFSATASAVIASGPKQDALPRRPQAGGRFPSDLQVNTQRGLQAPLSPSSGSSSLKDFQDHNVAAASALPGSGVGAHYSPTATYGEDLTSLTHAAQVNQYAMEDRVNPYTARPLSSYNVHENPGSSVFPEVVGAGLGGAALEAAGTEVHHQHKGNEAEEAAYNRQQEQRAAVEASAVAAPDTFEQHSGQKVAREAALYAAPHANLAPNPSDEQFMSGGRGMDNLTTTLNSDAYPERTTVGPQTQNVPNPLETVFRPLVEETARPTLAAGENHQSVQSISQLHIPGEFPSGNKA
ncbi:Phosphatidylinositol 4,5-bisphosphate-binding protein [Lachnellula occidentalis]|uniref:Phosphatidylinositol 4,5-bisphosphate-binding protein n=1 Tax=Lachnellula occidentalis TaxID=215460 RepID=A0A8H8UKI5_9HELO|nr:Phosphatidylinositol 4,5-bisphosphate-binding protein [Lachnellula occidentalis]